MLNVKKTIGLDQKSLDLLLKKQKELREERNSPNEMLLSLLFERAIITFYETAGEKLDATHGPIVKRQTVYIDPKTNAKYNELAFRYGYRLQELTNLAIKTIYAG